MFKLNTTFAKQEISNTWQNHSDTVQIARQMRKKDIVICTTYAEHSLTFYTDKNMNADSMC